MKPDILVVRNQAYQQLGTLVLLLSTLASIAKATSNESESILMLVCDVSCKTCTGPKNTDCASCDRNYTDHSKLYEGKCVSQCPIGMFDYDGVCTGN